MLGNRIFLSSDLPIATVALRSHGRRHDGFEALGYHKIGRATTGEIVWMSLVVWFGYVIWTSIRVATRRGLSTTTLIFNSHTIDQYHSSTTEEEATYDLKVALGTLMVFALHTFIHSLPG